MRSICSLLIVVATTAFGQDEPVATTKVKNPSSVRQQLRVARAEREARLREKYRVKGAGSELREAILTAAMPLFPVTPCRVFDSRNAIGTFGGPVLSGGTTRTIPIPQSPCGIPSTALAYSLNITVVPRGTLSYLSIWPAATAQPLVSTLNSFDGQVVSNAAIVPAGSNGAVDIFVTDLTDVIVDINAYFATSFGGAAFYAVAPCRVADTRPGSGKSGSFGSPTPTGGSTRSMAIPQSGCSIPADASAYSLNITVVPQGPLAYLTVFPSGVAQPLVSTLNSFAGRIVANAAIVPAGSGGAVNFFVTNTTDIIVDVNGYFR